MSTIWEALRAPFDHDQVGWVPIATVPRGAKGKDIEKVLLSPYADARAVQQRLDDVVGPENWQATYEAGPDGGVMCALSIRVEDEWVTKCDAAENTAVEEVKGGISNAFKRAAVAWGIGRYLYSIAPVWTKTDDRGRWNDPVLPATAGENPPNHNHQPAATKDPLALIRARLKKLGFNDDNVEAFFSFMAQQDKVDTVNDIPVGRQQLWFDRMAKQPDTEVRNAVLGAIRKSQEAA